MSEIVRIQKCVISFTVINSANGNVNVSAFNFFENKPQSFNPQPKIIRNQIGIIRQNIVIFFSVGNVQMKFIKILIIEQKFNIIGR